MQSSLLWGSNRGPRILSTAPSAESAMRPYIAPRIAHRPSPPCFLSFHLGPTLSQCFIQIVSAICNQANR